MKIITGASQGIGKFLFQKFREDTTEVFGLDYKFSEKDNVDNQFKIDISNKDEISRWVNVIKEDLSSIVLINCAGINYNSFAHKADLDKWEQVIKVNFLGTFFMIHNLLPIMREQSYGRIINFSSVVTQLPTVGTSAYTSSKTALNGLSKTIAKENASKNITINNIVLGYSEIGMGLNEITEDQRKELLNRIPMKRFCEPVEIYHTVQFLIENSYISGSCIDLNGGLV